MHFVVDHFHTIFRRLLLKNCLSSNHQNYCVSQFIIRVVHFHEWMVRYLLMYTLKLPLLGETVFADVQSLDVVPAFNYALVLGFLWCESSCELSNCPPSHFQNRLQLAENDWILFWFERMRIWRGDSMPEDSGALVWSSTTQLVTWRMCAGLDWLSARNVWDTEQLILK